jgi:hypothetical protein
MSNTVNSGKLQKFSKISDSYTAQGVLNTSTSKSRIKASRQNSTSKSIKQPSFDFPLLQGDHSDLKLSNKTLLSSEDSVKMSGKSQQRIRRMPA